MNFVPQHPSSFLPDEEVHVLERYCETDGAKEQIWKSHVSREVPLPPSIFDVGGGKL